MHLVLTGATGLVGSGVLHYMINAPNITKVSVLSRSPVPQAQGHPKINVIIHNDYTTYPDTVLSQLKDVHGVVWAQGISQTLVSREEYFQITHTYPLTFARAISQTTHPNPINFIYVSAIGATPTPGIFTPAYSTVKGRAEADLLSLSKTPEHSNLNFYCMRPCSVDMSAHEEIKPFVRPKVGVEKYLAPLAGRICRPFLSLYSPTREMGGFLSRLATGEIGDGGPLEGSGVEGEGRIVENAAFWRLMGR